MRREQNRRTPRVRAGATGCWATALWMVACVPPAPAEDQTNALVAQTEATTADVHLHRANTSAEGRARLAEAYLHPEFPSPTTHVLEAGPETVAWGYYWSEAEPVLRMNSGDVLDVTTMLTSNPTRLEAAGIPPDLVEPALRAIVDQVDDRGPGGHILTGPVWVEGAEPGDVLEVRVLGMQMPLPYGYNGCSGFMPELCPEAREDRTRIFWLDTLSMVAEYRPNVSGSQEVESDENARRAAEGAGTSSVGEGPGPVVRVPLHPFFGSMGVAPPPDAGRWSSVPPWIHGGNIDNKEFVPGTRLFLPVHVAGALFEVGDGHAAQGDGEVDQTAIETSLRGQLQLVVHKDGMPGGLGGAEGNAVPHTIQWPRAETPTHWIAMGMDEDLTVATQIAIEQAARMIADLYGMSVAEGYRLVSLAGDVRVTQLVDQNVGVHVMVPKGIVE